MAVNLIKAIAYLLLNAVQVYTLLRATRNGFSRAYA